MYFFNYCFLSILLVSNLLVSNIVCSQYFIEIEYPNQNKHENYQSLTISDTSLLRSLEEACSLLSAEQLTVLYNFMSFYLVFSSKVISATRVTILTHIQATKILNLSLDDSSVDNETITKNIELIQSLYTHLTQVLFEQEQASKAIDIFYADLDPVVKNVFLKLSDAIYMLIDKQEPFACAYNTVQNENAQLTVENVTYDLEHAINKREQFLYDSIINQQNFLASTLHKKSVLLWKNAKVYFDMLDMYVTILDMCKVVIKNKCSF